MQSKPCTSHHDPSLALPALSLVRPPLMTHTRHTCQHSYVTPTMDSWPGRRYSTNQSPRPQCSWALSTVSEQGCCWPLAKHKLRDTVFLQTLQT